MIDTEYETSLEDLFKFDLGGFNGPFVEPAMIQAIDQIEIETALSPGYSCAKEVCNELIRGDAPVLRQEFDSGDPRYEEAFDSFLDGGPPPFGIGIVTNDHTLGESLFTNDLSAGTQGTLLWIWALALKMATHYDWVEGWENKPAILLIDEIENHLHPTWQRRVIPALLKHFPGLQIFATTHSPFVVAGLKAGQVHLLKRDERGGVTVSTNPQDVVGWTADEILRNMMGVDDPTDDATAAAARELRQLRNEMPLADEEAEAERQERMQELRKRVDRDLLAGGPMAAQRERFEEDLAKILEEHRKSRDLNQDNG